MDKSCDECGSTFTTRSKSPNRERFCGKKCYRKFWNRITHRARHPARVLEPRSCISCGAVFTPDCKHSFAKTCSPKCSVKHQSEKQRVALAAKRDLSPRPCKECGGLFSPHKNAWRWRRYCSEKCSRKVSGRAFAERYPERILANEKKQRNKRLGGNWFAALERDGHKCQMCGTTRALHVHHLDGSGETDSPNHQLENLQTLCRSCHKQVHTITYRIVDGEIVVSCTMFKLLGLNSVKVT